MDEEKQVDDDIKFLLTRFDGEMLFMGFFVLLVLLYFVPGPYMVLYFFSGIATWNYFRHIANSRYEWLWFAMSMSGVTLVLGSDGGVELTLSNAFLCSLSIFLTVIYTYFVYACQKAQSKL